MSEHGDGDTPALIAIEEAIQFNIEHGGWLFADRSLFVNADWPNLGRAIIEALDDGRPVALCYHDGARRVIEARAPVTTS